jgi:hypothetical protein
VAVLTDLAQLEDRRQPTTTLEGWRRFVDADPPGFTMLPDDLWTAMAEDERVAYDEARIAHHAELVVVTTSAIQEITNEGRMLTLLNQRGNGARQGLIVSGEAATGKTTAIKQLGRFHELRTRRRFPGSDRIPVVYVTAPAKGSPRKLAMEFARFLGLPPIPSRANATDIADAVCQILIEARCDLVLIDELDNINMATTGGEDHSDHMKYLTEHLPATFIYAGIDVERANVFTGIRGRQLAGRCSLVNTGVAGMEAVLRLHRHEPGSLVKQAKYLHQRTQGMIGSLSRLVRQSAIRAILTDTEAITRPLMDKIRLDHSAESSTRRASTSR